jgi:NitT/TauT family transport system substrate-binding protein
MNRRTVLAGGAGMFALSTGVPAFGQASPVIRVGITENDSGICPVYAQELGMFVQAGLNVEITPIASSGASAQALVAGAVDITVCDAVQVANAVIHGFPMVALSGGCLFTKDAPTLVLAAKKDGSVRSAKGLEGQTVAVVALKSLSASAAIEWVRVNGADPAKVKFYELPFPDMNAAIERGTIAAGLLGEPFLTSGRASQRVLGVPFEAVAPTFYVNVYAASRDWATKNPMLAKKFSAVMFDAAKWANTHHADSAALETKITKIPLDVARSMVRNPFATTWDPKLVDPVLAIGARYKLMERPVTIAEITV